MRKLFTVIIALISFNTFAQIAEFPDPNKGNLAGGFGMSWINEQPYYNFRVKPELAFAKWGIGLDLNLEFGADGKLRDENFKTAAQYLSIIRYVRYGEKHDPVYVHVGQIDNYTLGHGNIMYGYSNSASFDNRKIGLAVDLNGEKLGLESIYSDFSTAPVIAVRGYLRPLKYTQAANLPIFSNIEVGLSFATDLNERAGALNVGYNLASKKFEVTNKKDNISIVGLDLGLPIVQNKVFNLELFVDYTKIVNFGEGTSAGLLAGLNGLGLFDVKAKFERRWNSDKYIPSYFNALHEVDRFSLNETNGVFTSKAAQLEATTATDNGWFGALSVNALGYANITGSYERLDKTPNSGMLHLWANLTPEKAPVVVKAGYDKEGIQSESEVFTTDERSHLFVEMGYKPMSYILVSLIYHWTFHPIYDNDKNVISYEPQKRLEPKVTFIYPFNVGK